MVLGWEVWYWDGRCGIGVGGVVTVILEYKKQNNIVKHRHKSMIKSEYLTSIYSSIDTD